MGKLVHGVRWHSGSSYNIPLDFVRLESDTHKWTGKARSADGSVSELSVFLGEHLPPSHPPASFVNVLLDYIKSSIGLV